MFCKLQHSLPKKMATYAVVRSGRCCFSYFVRYHTMITVIIRVCVLVFGRAGWQRRAHVPRPRILPLLLLLCTTLVYIASTFLLHFFYVSSTFLLHFCQYTGHLNRCTWGWANCSAKKTKISRKTSLELLLVSSLVHQEGAEILSVISPPSRTQRKKWHPLLAVLKILAD